MPDAEAPPPKPAWLDSAVARRLLADTQPALAHLVRRCHGDTMIWAGADASSALAMQRCMVRNRFFVAGDRGPTKPPTEADAVLLEADLQQLPLPTSCADAVILHHALESLRDPRNALREVSRVLQPGGRLVLCGFNPWSLLGVRRAYARLAPDAFSGVRFVNPIRLLDWLAVLGFDLEGPVRYASYGLPFRGPRVSAEESPDSLPYAKHRAGGIEIPLADAYLLSAVKQAYGVPPLRRVEQPPVGKLAGVAFPRVSAPRVSAQLVRVDFRGDDR